MFKRPFQFLFQALTAERSPRQIALAIALGVVLGILPKANLIAVVLVVLMFALRTNLAAGLLTASVCTWLGPGFDAIFHRVGETVLTFGPLQGIFSFLYKLPYAPWTGFNNTVVAGALIVGLVQFVPTYMWCRRMFRDRSENEQPRPTVPTPKYTRPRKNRRFLIGADARH